MTDPAPAGLLLVDKPQGPTSHGVVARVRRAAGTKRVGHAGTLDPMATGLLVLGIGHGTKLLTYAVGLDKSYTATIRLGEGTVTDDAEGETVTAPGADADSAAFAPERLAAAAETLRGDIHQVPSAVSAIKVDGKRSYARVRAGEEVELAARPVRVSRFELRAVRPGRSGATPVVDLEVAVDCSSGTYVRALARDLAAELGTAGHLTALRRTRVGPFDVADAVALDDLAGDSSAHGIERGGGWPPATPDPEPLGRAAAHLLPTAALADQQVVDVGHGKRIELAAGRGSGPLAALDPAGRLVAVLVRAGDRWRPDLVIPVEKRT